VWRLYLIDTYTSNENIPTPASMTNVSEVAYQQSKEQCMFEIIETIASRLLAVENRRSPPRRTPARRCTSNARSAVTKGIDAGALTSIAMTGPAHIHVQQIVVDSGRSDVLVCLRSQSLRFERRDD
jgi:hypothetical protein